MLPKTTIFSSKIFETRPEWASSYDLVNFYYDILMKRYSYKKFVNEQSSFLAFCEVIIPYHFSQGRHNHLPSQVIQYRKIFPRSHQTMVAHAHKRSVISGKRWQRNVFAWLPSWCDKCILQYIDISKIREIYY